MQTTIDLGNEIKSVIERILVDVYFNPEKEYTVAEIDAIRLLFDNFLRSLVEVE